MAQQPRITTRTIEEIEDVMDVIDVLMATTCPVCSAVNAICIHQVDALHREVHEAHHHASYADSSFAYGMAIFRLGPEARMPELRARELRADFGVCVDINTARQHTKKRHRGANHDDAA